MCVCAPGRGRQARKPVRHIDLRLTPAAQSEGALGLRVGLFLCDLALALVGLSIVFDVLAQHDAAAD